VHKNHIHEVVPGFASVVAAVVALAQASRQPQPIAAPCCGGLQQPPPQQQRQQQLHHNIAHL